MDCRDDLLQVNEVPPSLHEVLSVPESARKVIDVRTREKLPYRLDAHRVEVARPSATVAGDCDVALAFSYIVPIYLDRVESISMDLFGLQSQKRRADHHGKTKDILRGPQFASRSHTCKRPCLAAAITKVLMRSCLA